MGHGVHLGKMLKASAEPCPGGARELYPTCALLLGSSVGRGPSLLLPRFDKHGLSITPRLTPSSSRPEASSTRRPARPRVRRTRACDSLTTRSSPPASSLRSCIFVMPQAPEWEPLHLESPRASCASRRNMHESGRMPAHFCLRRSISVSCLAIRQNAPACNEGVSQAAPSPSICP